MTLTGRILPIGGVKEKALAARRAGVTTILFPEANRADYDELSGAPLGLLTARDTFQAAAGLDGVLCACIRRPPGTPCSFTSRKHSVHGCGTSCG